MAKKDRNDETPIEFYIPGPGRRGPKIPVPINQPNWVYKTSSNSKPGFSEWLFIGLILIFTITLAILLIAGSMFKSPVWIAVIVFGILAISLTRSAIIRTINHAQEDEAIDLPKKKERKHPKRRKDYK